MLLMSNALLPFFFFNKEAILDGIDCVRLGVGLGVEVGVDGDDTTVGNDKLLARFCSWAAGGRSEQTRIYYFSNIKSIGTKILVLRSKKSIFDPFYSFT